TWYTTLLCIVPPNKGCGWHTAQANGRFAPPDGVQRIASSRPTGPCKKKFRESCPVVMRAGYSYVWMGVLKLPIPRTRTKILHFRIASSFAPVIGSPRPRNIRRADG